MPPCGLSRAAKLTQTAPAIPSLQVGARQAFSRPSGAPAPRLRSPPEEPLARNSTPPSRLCDNAPTNVETKSEPAEAPPEQATAAEPAKAEPARAEPAGAEPVNIETPTPKPDPRASRLPASAQIEDLFAAVRRLEAFASDEAKRVSGKLVPSVEDHAKKHIWVSLLLALGLGLILGMWLRGGRRRE